MVIVIVLFISNSKEPGRVIYLRSHYPLIWPIFLILSHIKVTTYTYYTLKYNTSMSAKAETNGGKYTFSLNRNPFGPSVYGSFSPCASLLLTKGADTER